MNSASATIYRYRLPLTQPLALRGAMIQERTGALVRIQSASGVTGWGDIAPLPGFSIESFEDAVTQAVQVASVLVRRNLDNVDRRLIGLRRQDDYHPSVRFGLESALASLQAIHSDTIPARLLSDSPPARVHANALLMAPRHTVVDEALRLCERGYRAVKLKVGRDSLREEAAIVRDLLSNLEADVEIRLDANRAWNFEDARTFCAAVNPDRIRYIEEPLHNPARLPELARASGIHYAVDESLQQLGWRIAGSLREHGRDALDRYPAYPDTPLADAALHAAAWVVKPTLFGAPLEFFSAAAPCGGYGGPVVVSSSFESGLGLAMLAQLAAAANRDKIPLGLDTQRWFGTDTLEEDLLEVDGTCDLQRTWALALKPRADRLEEIAHV